MINDDSSYVKNIFEQLGTKKLTIFIHGGLNTFQNATKKANQILTYYDDKDSHIVIIGWDAGPITNYWDYLVFIRNGERRSLLGPLTSPFILVEDTARSIVNAPRATTETLMIQSTVPISRFTGEEHAYETNLANLKAETDGINIKETGKTRGLELKNIVSIVNPIKFVTAPFVDGFGRGTWNSLSRRTELLISKDTAFQRKNNSRTAVYKFLDLIEKSNSKPEITLIGHSMGSMVANNILIRKPSLSYKNIVYMGAAASLKDVESNVVPYLIKNENVNFYSLSLDPYREISESKVFDSLPRGSLLIWIDTYLTSIKSFTDKTSGSWFNMVRAADTIFPDSVKKQVYLTKFGFGTGQQTHGEFDEYKFWNSNYWTGSEQCGLLLMHQTIESKKLRAECNDKDKIVKNRMIKEASSTEK